MKLLLSVALYLIILLSIDSQTGASGFKNDWKNVTVSQRTESFLNVSLYAMDWTIRNFSYFSERGHYLDTPEFSVPHFPDVVWYLNIVSYGSSWLYFRVYRRTPNGENSVKYRLSFIGSDGNLYKLYETSEFYSFYGNGGSSQVYLNASAITDSTKRIYNKTTDTLRIRFEMQTLLGASSVNSNGVEARRFDVPVCDFNQESASLLVSSMKYSNAVFRFDNNQTSLAAVAILAHKSRFFDELFARSLPQTKYEIRLPNIDNAVFNIVARNVYTGECRLLPTMEKSIFKAVVRFGLFDLQVKCELALSKLVHIDNAIEWLKFAQQNNASQLEKYVFDYVRKNSAHISTADWVEMVKALK